MENFQYNPVTGEMDMVSKPTAPSDKLSFKVVADPDHPTDHTLIISLTTNINN